MPTDKKQYQREYYLKHKANIQASRRKHYVAHKEAYLASKRRFSRHNPDANKNEWRKRKEIGHKMRQQSIAYLGNKCCECGLIDDPIIYDFHHLRDKKAGIARMLHSRSWTAIKQELDKCCLLCVLCHRKAHKFSNKRMSQRRSMLRDKAVAYLGGKCCVCGRSDDACTYDFHHLRDKKMTISAAIMQCGWNTIEAELQKCVLLCCLCHRKLHGDKITLDNRATA